MRKVLFLLILLIGCGNKNPYITGGIIDLQANRTEDAIKQFQQAIEVDPKNPDGYIWLGKAHATKKEYNKACNEFDRAFKVDPTKREKLKNEREYFWAVGINAAIQHLNDKEFKEAEIRLKDAVDWVPDSSETYNRLGYTYSQLDQDDDAIKSYRKSIVLNPKDPEPRINLARLLIDKKNNDEAINTLEEALKQDPESGKSHYYLGVALSNKEMKDEALEHFRKAAELDPVDRDAFFNIGVLLIQKEQYEDALVPLKKVTDIDKDDKEAWYWVSSAHLMMKDYDKAIEISTRAIEIDPTYADAYFQRGVAKREKGLKSQAAEDFKRAEELKKGG
jgi:tetratricopeptide (TPR) repeat protein